MPSGSVNCAEPRGGVTHPFTQVEVVPPCVGGGDVGGGGGATGVLVAGAVVGEMGAGYVALRAGAGVPPQEADGAAATSTRVMMRCRRDVTRTP